MGQTAAEPVQASRTWVMTKPVAAQASKVISQKLITRLQHPIELELRLWDWMLDMLGSTTLAMLSTVLGVYFGRIAERRDRTMVLTIYILVWSAFTMLGGAVIGFVQFLLLRFGVAVGAMLGGVVCPAWGWRWTFVVAGATGVILALLTWLTIREPRRARPRDTDGYRHASSPRPCWPGRPSAILPLPLPLPLR